MAGDWAGEERERCAGARVAGGDRPHPERYGTGDIGRYLPSIGEVLSLCSMGEVLYPTARMSYVHKRIVTCLHIGMNTLAPLGPWQFRATAIRNTRLQHECLLSNVV